MIRNPILLTIVFPGSLAFPCDAAAAQPRVQGAHCTEEQRIPGTGSPRLQCATHAPWTAVLSSHPSHPMAWKLLFPPAFPIKHLHTCLTLGESKVELLMETHLLEQGFYFFFFLPINSSRSLWPRHVINCESAQKGKTIWAKNLFEVVEPNRRGWGFISTAADLGITEDNEGLP